MWFARKPDKGRVISALNETPITNYELWLCLAKDLKGMGIPGEYVESMMERYLSDKATPVTGLYNEINPEKPLKSPVLTRCIFNYEDMPLEKIRDIDSPHYSDLYTLSGIIAITNALWYDEKDRKTKQQFDIGAFGEEYSGVLTNIFRKEILPYLSKDELILAAKDKYEKNKVLTRNDLSGRGMNEALTKLFREPVERATP